MLWQKESIRKVTGGRRRPAVMKRRAEIGLAPADTHIGDERRRIIRTFGGNEKSRALRASFVNVTNAKGETKKVRIMNVEENSANPNYVRWKPAHERRYPQDRDRPARISSRPGQDGVINAVLLE